MVRSGARAGERWGQLLGLRPRKGAREGARRLIDAAASGVCTRLWQLVPERGEWGRLGDPGMLQAVSHDCTTWH